jgi:hypothetical protein
MNVLQTKNDGPTLKMGGTRVSKMTMTKSDQMHVIKLSLKNDQVLTSCSTV